MHTFYYLNVHIMLCWEHAISDNKIPFHLTFCHITHRISFPKRDWAWTRQRKKKKKNYNSVYWNSHYQQQLLYKYVIIYQQLTS